MLHHLWFGQIIRGGKTPTLLVALQTQRVIPLQPRQTAINGYTVLTLILALLSKVSSIKKPRNRRGFLFNKLKRLIPVFFKLIPKYKGSYKGQNGERENIIHRTNITILTEPMNERQCHTANNRI